MLDDVATTSVGAGVTRTRWQPVAELGEGATRGLTLSGIVARVADVLMNDAVGIEVRFVADACIPSAVVLGESG